MLQGHCGAPGPLNRSASTFPPGVPQPTTQARRVMSAILCVLQQQDKEINGLKLCERSLGRSVPHRVMTDVWHGKYAAPLISVSGTKTKKGRWSQGCGRDRQPHFAGCHLEMISTNCSHEKCKLSFRVNQSDLSKADTYPLSLVPVCTHSLYMEWKNWSGS